MNKKFKIRANVRNFNLIFVIFILLFTLTTNRYALSEELYSFHTSERGKLWKNFQHNVFGFSIDIPNNWQFGVVTQGNTPVILLYPDGMATNKLSDNYKTIEISSFEFAPIPSNNIHSLIKYVLSGLIMAHPQSNMLSPPTENFSNKSISAVISWPSKTGFIIVEDITIYKRNDGNAMSLNIRSEQNAYKEDLSLLKDISSTIKFTK